MARLYAARRLSGRPEVILLVVLAVVLGWLVVPPLVILVYRSVSGPDGFTTANFSIVGQSLTGGPALLTNSIVFALGGACVSVVLGTTLAWLAERTNAPFGGVAYLAAFISFAVPGLIKIIAYILLLGPNAGFINVWLEGIFGFSSPPFNIFSMGGMIAVEGLTWTPVVFLLMAAPFRAMDPALEEAAAMAGANPLTTLRRVTFRLALPSLAAVLILTVVRSLQSFDIGAILGIPANIPLFTTQIYISLTSGFLPSYGQASAYSVVLVVIVALALIPYYRLSQSGQRYATITGKGYRPRRLDLGRARWVGGLSLLLLPALLVLPLFVMLWVSVTPFVQAPSMAALADVSLANYGLAFSDSTIASSISNTLIVSVASASAVTVLTLLAAWLVVRTKMAARWSVDFLSTVPLVFPGIVLGLGVLTVYLIVPNPIYGTVWIIVVAYVAKFLPYGMRYNVAGLLSIHQELEESARMSGAPMRGVLRRIVAPLLMPTLMSTWIYIFLVTSHELSEALLLRGPGNSILSTTIWDLWRNGSLGVLAAFSVTVTTGLVLICFVLLRLSRRGMEVV